MTQQYDLPPLKAGKLPTLNQDEYPGLGNWWVQLRTGPDNDEVFARVYGDCPEQAAQRAEAIAAIEADRQRRGESVAWATHHDEPMLFPSRAEAAAYCDDDEEPIPLCACAEHTTPEPPCDT